MPNNQACHRDAWRSVAPPGTAGQLRSSRARSRARAQHRASAIIDVVIGALAPPRLPEAAVGAANGANTTAWCSAGIDPRNGAPLRLSRDAGRRHRRTQSIKRRQGRRAGAHHQHVQPARRGDRDGVSAAAWRSTRWSPDSGGAGRFRGGLGAARSVRPVGHTCEFNGVGERFRLSRPWGIFGGEPGLRGRFQLHARGRCTVGVPPRRAAWARAGPSSDRRTPGAGGYGPARRAQPSRRGTRSPVRQVHHGLLAPPLRRWVIDTSELKP